MARDPPRRAGGLTPGPALGSGRGREVRVEVRQSGRGAANPPAPRQADKLPENRPLVAGLRLSTLGQRDQPNAERLTQFRG
ncbi:hypothetical protein RU09_00165 [Microbacterium sp. MEJ108Y]|nr:hypothetical protein RU09_00165 [Microbacterium sp. MEJ108Y]